MDSRDERAKRNTPVKRLERRAERAAPWLALYRAARAVTKRTRAELYAQHKFSVADLDPEMLALTNAVDAVGYPFDDE